MLVGQKTRRGRRAGGGEEARGSQGKSSGAEGADEGEVWGPHVRGVFRAPPLCGRRREERTERPVRRGWLWAGGARGQAAVGRRVLYCGHLHSEFAICHDLLSNADPLICEGPAAKLCGVEGRSGGGSGLI